MPNHPQRTTAAAAKAAVAKPEQAYNQSSSRSDLRMSRPAMNGHQRARDDNKGGDLR